jgi:membrane-associated phospholipid phosphatase
MARADTTYDLARFFTREGVAIYLAAGVGLPLLRDGHQARDHFLRAGETLGIATGVTEIMKYTIAERRPNGTDRKSMPSGHTAAAFAVATMESQFHPKEAPLWYTGAALIAWSRVDLREHHTYDVVAGALIGYGIARLELSQKHGLILTPWIGHDSGSAGVSLTGTF